MKLEIILFGCLVAVAVASSDIIELQTRGSEKIYNFFPLRSDFLKFSVRASNDIHILLAETYAMEGKYYEIVFGGWQNTRSVIRRDTQTNEVASVQGNPANGAKFQTYWVSLNATEGSIEVGVTDLTKPIMSYVDPNFFNATYFGVSTGFMAEGVWQFGSDLFNKNENINEICN